MKNKIIAIISILIATSFLTIPARCAITLGVKVNDWAIYHDTYVGGEFPADMNGSKVVFSAITANTESNHDGYNVIEEQISMFTNGSTQSEGSTTSFVGKITSPFTHFSTGSYIAVPNLKVNDTTIFSGLPILLNVSSIETVMCMGINRQVAKVLSSSSLGTSNVAYDVATGLLISNIGSMTSPSYSWTKELISTNIFSAVDTNATDILSQINGYLRPFTEPIGKTLLNLTNSMNISALTNMITFFFIDQPAIFVGGVGLVIILIVAISLRKKKPQQNP